MIIIRRWPELKGRFPRPVVALGKFDGVHRGHQRLLTAVIGLARRRGTSSMAVTFDIHPHRLLRPRSVPPLLMTAEEKAEQIGISGVDVLLYLRFTREFARLTAWEFARDYLSGKIGAGMILAGANFRFGRNRTGDVEKLRRWGRKLGFTFRVVPQVKVGGRPVTSSRVRKVIAAGDMSQATRLLGRPYSLEGVIGPGAGRGKRLGAPTANLKLPKKLLPSDGVYLARTALGGQEPLPSVVNIGFSPTFGGGTRRLEVHLLDFSGRLYGRGARVHFERFLRPERRFHSPEELARQIKRDIRRAGTHFRKAR